MRTRTRVVAWVLAVLMSSITVIALLAIPGTSLRKHRVPWWFIWRMLPAMIACPLWVALLNRKAWAWWPIVVLHSLVGLSWISAIVRMPGYYLSHPRLDHNLYAVLAFDIVWMMLVAVLPLWALLSAPPSGWANPQSEIPNPQ